MNDSLVEKQYIFNVLILNHCYFHGLERKRESGHSYVRTRTK